MGRGRSKNKESYCAENQLRDCVELVLEDAPTYEAAAPQVEAPVLYLYKVQVNHPSLRKRAAPSAEAEVLDYITDRGVYEIYEEVDGWGRLYDDSWIMLQFTFKIR